MSLNLLSDFDGVLTELTQEARRVRNIFFSLCNLSEQSKTVEEAVRTSTTPCGWEFDGRITAFADEDDFVFINGVAAWLDHGGENLRSLRDTALKHIQSLGHPDFKDAARSAYDQMVKEVMSSSDSPIDPSTRPVLEGLQSRGLSVTIVSNSGTARIEDIFKKAGLTTGGSLTVKGGARKFELGTPPSLVKIGNRTVDVCRPTYESIIREEAKKGTVLGVVGDVFSLDLAAPISLALKEPGLFPKGLKLFLRQRPYTPQWARDAIKSFSAPGVTLYGIDSLDQIPPLLLG